MKALAGQSVAFDPGNCCGARDYEYTQGGTNRNGSTIEAWVIQRCTHCHRAFRVLAYCKQAGDEDATARQFKHRISKTKKFAIPSTPVRLAIWRDDPPVSIEEARSYERETSPEPRTRRRATRELAGPGRIYHLFPLGNIPRTSRRVCPQISAPALVASYRYHQGRQMNLFHEREVEEIEEDLEEHITKRDVVEAFNYLGKQWNKALANVYQQIEQLNRRIQLSDQSLEQRFLADEATIDGLTGAVSTTFADLSAEFQALKDKVAAETGQVTAADLDGLETKLSSLGSAVGGLSQLAPPTAVTPPVDTTPPVDGAPVETAPPADPTAPVETEPTAPAPEAPVAAPASTDTGATTETGSLPGGETVTSTDAPAADGTATQ